MLKSNQVFILFFIEKTCYKINYDLFLEHKQISIKDNIKRVFLKFKLSARIKNGLNLIIKFIFIIISTKIHFINILKYRTNWLLLEF